MAIGRITGPMLFSNLDRQGVSLQVDTDLVFFDVTNRRLGVNKTNPGYSLDVNGNAHLGNIYILGNTISSETGKIGLGTINGLIVSGGSLNNVIVTDGVGNLSFTNIGSLPDLIAANASVATLNASIGAYQTYANANTSTQANSINTINANLGAYQTYANTQVSTINANLGAYETWANATFATSTSETQLSANVGAYQIWANANVAGLQNQINGVNTSIQTLSANVGSYENTTNANVGTIYNNLNTLIANVGSYENTTNANVGTIYNHVNTIDANIGAFETYANLYLGASSYGNANVATYLLHFGSSSIVTTGSITGNIVTNYITAVTGNVISFNGTGAIALPVGTAGQEPTGSAGLIRFNSTTSSVEFYDGTGWVSVVNAISNQRIYPDGIVNTFALDYTSTANSILVSVNGVLQQPNLAYTVTGNQITFFDVPGTTDTIDIRFISITITQSTNLPTVIDSSPTVVTTANTIVDTFLSATYRSAKYTISSTTATDAHMAEILLSQLNGVPTITVYGVTNTGSNGITYYANVNGGTINLLARGTTSSNIRLQTTYFST
jgi:hypothetical protein